MIGCSEFRMLAAKTTASYVPKIKRRSCAQTKGCQPSAISTAPSRYTRLLQIVLRLYNASIFTTNSSNWNTSAWTKWLWIDSQQRPRPSVVILALEWTVGLMAHVMGEPAIAKACFRESCAKNAHACTAFVLKDRVHAITVGLESNATWSNVRYSSYTCTALLLAVHQLNVSRLSYFVCAACREAPRVYRSNSYDCPGNDAPGYQGHVYPDLAACYDICQRSPSCNFFTYWPTNTPMEGGCWPKTQCPNSGGGASGNQGTIYYRDCE